MLERAAALQPRVGTGCATRATGCSSCASRSSAPAATSSTSRSSRCVHGAGFDYRVAAALAFLVAVTNNFWWNRHWTFDARDGHAGFQAARFLVVSRRRLRVQPRRARLLVAVAGLAEVPAQAIAIAAATPLNFLGNKLWSFRR